VPEREKATKPEDITRLFVERSDAGDAEGVAAHLALTSTARKDGTGARVQVARRQPDGSWLRVLDLPELTLPASS
jgi:hypothetical protein